MRAGSVQSGLREVEAAQLWGWGHRGRPRPVGQVSEPGSGFAHGSPWLFPAPQKASLGQDREPDGGHKAEDTGDTHHVNARHLLYPNSHVTRFPVPNEKVPWEVSAGLSRRRPVSWGSGPCEPSDPAGHQVASPAAASQGHAGQRRKLSHAGPHS